jgi:DNA-binding NarL/FixJ family response regulator
MPNTTKNIVLVDDHIIIRNGLKELIAKLGPYHIVAEYDNGKDFVTALPIVPTPDLIVMDLSMPQMDGDEVMDVLIQKGLDLPVLILTLNNDENRLIRLFRQGVKGYLQKNCTAAMLKEALNEIFTKGYYHNEHTLYALRAQDRPAKKTDQELILEKLSAREKEFLKLICHPEEYTYQQIAGIMHVQHRTVDGYRETIFEKLGIKSKTGLVLFILRHKLLEHLQ